MNNFNPFNFNPFVFNNLPPNKFPNLDNKENSIAEQKILPMSQLETYAELSKRFSLLPVNPKSKVAAIKKWPERCSKKVRFIENDYKDSNGNIRNAGIACGSASGLIVLDIDDVNQFNEWCNSKCLSNPIPETFTVESGGKSHHHYFKYPEDGNKYHKQEISGAKLIGIGGYVVAPSSIHPSGKPYTIIKNIPIAAAPKWILDVMLSNKQLNKISDNTQNVEIIIESFLQDLVKTPVTHNIQSGVLSAIIEVSQSNSSCELPTAQIHKTYNDNAPQSSILNSDKSFGRLLVKTLNGYNIQFIKKKLSINGKTPQGIVLEQESIELIKKLVNEQ